MLSEEIIRSLAPRARDDYVAALLNGGSTFDTYGINTPPRLTSLLATALHETGGLTIVRESGNYSAARLVAVWPNHFNARNAGAYEHNEQKLFNFIYGPKSSIGKDLGNTQEGDGFAFRGGGFFQTTGRDNYTRLGKEIGVDLAGTPQLIEDPAISLKAAAWELAKFLPFCDRGAAGFRGVCNGINRGNALSKLDPIGWADRQTWYARVSAALGAAGAVDDVLDYGDQGALVVAVQGRLGTLGYGSGRADGVFGSRTRAAVAAFQLENGLPGTGAVDAPTRAALNAETAKPMPVGERATETVADLAAAGSITIGTTQKLKAAAGTLIALGGVTGGAQQSGVAPAASPDLIAVTKDTVAEIGTWKAIILSMQETWVWLTSHWWIFAIALGFAMYRWGKKIEWRRVLDHQLGLNLSR